MNGRTGMSGRTGAVVVRRADEADLGFIMATERLAGYDRFIGRSCEARHRVRMADRRCAHFIAWVPNGSIVDGPIVAGTIVDETGANRTGAESRVGFAILRDWDAADGVTLLMRIAMAQPGLGHGTAFLRALIDRVFTTTRCHRFWLGQFPDNARARHVYESVGFIAEGIARGSVFLNGRHHDELILAILRSDWERRRAGQGAAGQGAGEAAARPS